MPRTNTKLLPVLIGWLVEVRCRHQYRNTYVPVSTLYCHFKCDNRSDLSMKSFTRLMSKCVQLDMSIKMKTHRSINDRNLNRSYYLSYTPGDAPIDNPTENEFTHQLSSTNIQIVTPTKQKANDVVQEKTHLCVSNTVSDALTLLSRAANSLESLTETTDELLDSTPSSSTYQSIPNQIPIQRFSSQPIESMVVSTHEHQIIQEITNDISLHDVHSIHQSNPPQTRNPRFDSQPIAASQPFNPIHPFLPLAFKYIQSSNHLSYIDVPRYDHRVSFISQDSPPRIIESIGSVSRTSTEMKWHMVSMGIEMGYSRLSVKNKIILAQAIIKTESYLNGYSKDLCVPRSFDRWFVLYDNNKKGKGDIRLVNDLFSDLAGCHTIPYTTMIQKHFPGFLHTMFRYAGNTHGYDANIPTLYSSMNDKARANFTSCPVRGNLDLTKFKFEFFFNENKGTIKEDVSSPRLTDDHKSNRLVFAITYKEKIEKSNTVVEKRVSFYYCFLDEKWFYIFTSRKRRKCLPAGPGETHDDVFVPARKIRSRRFVEKVMFMGVVAPPDLENRFDGKIFMKRVSKQVKSKRLSYHTKFSDNYHINQLLRTEEWKSTCYMQDMCPRHLFESIKDTYNLDDCITYDLVCSYHTFKTVNSKQHQVVRVDRKELKQLLKLDIRRSVGGELSKLKLSDITLHVRVEAGSYYEKDINCDSTFMLGAIREVGQAIRDKMHYIPNWEPIYLFMDNAGGHGTDKVKEEYINILKVDFNVIVAWQVPQSPETNMLDLGAWMTIQSVVEKLHRQRPMNNDALADTVFQAFDEFDGYTKLAAIGTRWKTVLDLIIDDKGGNDLVETRRGALTKTLVGKKLPLSDVYALEAARKTD